MSVPPPSFQHPGSPPPRPELPEGVERPEPSHAADGFPRWPLWAPFAGMLLTLVAALVAVALLVCVMAPIAEELFFRGFVFTAFRRSLGLPVAAVLTGAIFGAIHLGGTEIEFIVPLAVFGVLLCLLYVWTDSLLPCIVLHALNNALALGVAEDWGAWTPLAMVAAAAVCLSISLPVARRSRMVPA